MCLQDQEGPRLGEKVFPDKGVWLRLDPGCGTQPSMLGIIFLIFLAIKAFPL